MALETLKDAVEARGPYAVWDLMDEEERREAAAATWDAADAETRSLVQAAMARELKFRPQTVRKLPAAKVAGRLAQVAKDLPENVLFQFLFHHHMENRRPLLVEFLDTVGLPHEEGVLDLPEDAAPPEEARVRKAAEALLAAHGTRGLVYLATLFVADPEFWAGLGPVLAAHDPEGTPVSGEGGA